MWERLSAKMSQVLAGLEILTQDWLTFDRFQALLMASYRCFLMILVSLPTAHLNRQVR